MRIAQEPLSSQESAELSQLLADGASKTLAYARGVFAAAATSPTQLETTDWLPLLLGSEATSAVELKRCLSLLMREYNACADCLDLQVPAVPQAEQTDEIIDFCKGYLVVAGRDPAWKKDTDSFALSAPLMALSGYADFATLQSLLARDATSPRVEGEPLNIVDEDSTLREYRETLSDAIYGLYQHFAAARKSSKHQSAQTSSKVGRNEACPCGSGKKYKKCCAIQTS